MNRFSLTFSALISAISVQFFCGPPRLPAGAMRLDSAWYARARSWAIFRLSCSAKTIRRPFRLTPEASLSLRRERCNRSARRRTSTCARTSEYRDGDRGVASIAATKDFSPESSRRRRASSRDRKSLNSAVRSSADDSVADSDSCARPRKFAPYRRESTALAALSASSARSAAPPLQ
jgi:hypothetical protein